MISSFQKICTLDWFTGIATFTVKMKPSHGSSVVMGICIAFINTFRESGDPSILDKKENGW